MMFFIAKAQSLLIRYRSPRIRLAIDGSPLAKMKEVEQDGISNDQVEINGNSTVRVRWYHTFGLFG
jgi:hypothetical protein